MRLAVLSRVISRNWTNSADRTTFNIVVVFGENSPSDLVAQLQSIPIYFLLHSNEMELVLQGRVNSKHSNS